MKKILSLVLSLIIVSVLFCSCGKSGQKLALLIPEGTTDYLTGLNYFAEKYYDDYNKEIVLFKAKDQKTQSQQIEDLSRDEYQLAIICPIGDQSEAVKTIKQKNIKLMYFMQKASDDYDSFYYMDINSAGTSAAQYIYAKRQNVKQANIAIINTEDSESSSLTTAFLTEAEKYPVIACNNKYTLDAITESNVKWALSMANKEVKGLNGIYCTDDKIAEIAAKIVKEKYSNIDVIIGCGAKQCFLSKIEDSNILLATSFYSPLMIRDCIINAVNLVNGSTVNKDVSITSHIIDSSNVRQYIDIQSNY